MAEAAGFGGVHPARLRGVGIRGRGESQAAGLSDRSVAQTSKAAFGDCHRSERSRKVYADRVGRSTLTPPEDVLLYSRLTPAALYYMDHNLTGLLLILEERAGGEALDYSIRTLQSRQALRLAVPIKDPVTGKITTQTYEVKGPVAYLETTTSTYLNPENASRCFELFMDETEEQTKRIFAQQRRNRVVPDVDSDTLLDAIKRKHHNGQRMLKPLQVYVPYAELISFPSKWLRTRRDHERFLCLVEVIAFLHQHQRAHGQTSDGKPSILANLDDYSLAYQLALDVLTSTLHELGREAQELGLKLLSSSPEPIPRSPKTSSLRSRTCAKKPTSATTAYAKQWPSWLKWNT